ncbi:MAG: CoA pyrophosphatase [Hahellaceae bacterium]|nr:CoA pyrophosphatase [Hahellaceae bacterium]
MIAKALQILRPYKIPFRRQMRRSAVAIIYRDHPSRGRELFFIERARRPGDPWSGDMAFPGGKMHSDDVSICATAKRETREETGIDLDQSAHYEGRLRDVLTRRHNQFRPMVVTPHLFRLMEEPLLELNHEVAGVLWVPLAFLDDPANLSTTPWRMRGVSLKMPCYYFEDKCIWGLSFQMLQDLRASGRLKAGR